MLESVTSTALTSALAALSLRQSAIASNIANVNTPNYHAKQVAFESALAKSVADGSGSTAATTTESLEPTNVNGNNVNLDTETLANTSTVLRYQFAAQAMNMPFSAVRAAMKTA